VVVDWIAVVQDEEEWWIFVNVVMKFQVPKNAGIFLKG
jgi:hypothetical protein